MVKGYMKFTNHVGGNTNNAYNPASGIFKAPKTGRYSFKIKMDVNNTANTGYYYHIHFHVNGSDKSVVYGTSTLYGSPVDSRHFTIEYDLSENDEVALFVDTHSSTKFNRTSFFEGKLEK